MLSTHVALHVGFCFESLFACGALERVFCQVIVLCGLVEPSFLHITEGLFTEIALDSFPIFLTVNFLDVNSQFLFICHF